MLGVEVFFLAPTASGDDDVRSSVRSSVRHCRLHLHVLAASPQNTDEFAEKPVFLSFLVGLIKALGSHGGVGWELRRLY